jgi:hypothetical protein
VYLGQEHAQESSRACIHVACYGNIVFRTCSYTYPILFHEFSTTVWFFTGLPSPPHPPLASVASELFVTWEEKGSSSKEFRSADPFFFNSCGGSCEESWASFADCVDARMCRRTPVDDVTSRRIFQTDTRWSNSFRTWNLTKMAILRRVDRTTKIVKVSQLWSASSTQFLYFS